MTIKVLMVGHGAFAQKHMDAIKNIPGVEIASICGRREEATKEVAVKYGVKHWGIDLGECLKQNVDAVIITSATQVHAAQAIQCLKAGKHVQVEIPMADSIKDSRAILAAQNEMNAKGNKLVAMAGHTRRFNPSHQWVHNRIKKGELKVLQMDVQTYFFRRTNMNAAGQPRSWTDHLLWHHACHTVDLFSYQTGEPVKHAFALEGPHHPELKIAMDMSIQLKTAGGAVCTLSLSFNNDGPLGTFFRYICDNGTYLCRYDDLFNGKNEQIDVSKVDVSMNGIELQDREFFAAIKEGREPNASIAQCLPAMETLDRLEQCLNSTK
ncbi:MAG TPA: Gfo/Idh/MocA family oxidoreductase [Candidatus Acidoferrum sp.]|nr:Gfo/Idh/MocA family oxidoreductase [Candidatus Acidoferrum sp.]